MRLYTLATSVTSSVLPFTVSSLCRDTCSAGGLSLCVSHQFGDWAASMEPMSCLILQHGSRVAIWCRKSGLFMPAALDQGRLDMLVCQPAVRVLQMLGKLLDIPFMSLVKERGRGKTERDEGLGTACQSSSTV